MSLMGRLEKFVAIGSGRWTQADLERQQCAADVTDSSRQKQTRMDGDCRALMARSRPLRLKPVAHAGHARGNTFRATLP